MSIQDHQLVGNSLAANQQNETISYIDLAPAAPVPSPEIVNSPYHAFGGPLFIDETNSGPLFIDETNSAAASPQEVGSFVPSTSADTEDPHKPAGSKTRRRKRESKPKLYQRKEPLSDPEKEQKRKNAINSKINRDKKKSKMQEQENLIKSLTAQLNALRAALIVEREAHHATRKKCDAFERHLKDVCKQFNVPVIILPE